MTEKKVVSVVTFRVSPAKVDSVSAKVKAVLRQRLPGMPGFIEATLLTNEERTQLIVTSAWRSRHRWAAAQWDEDVDRAIVDAFEDTASYDIRLLSVLDRVKSYTRSERGRSPEHTSINDAQQ